MHGYINALLQPKKKEVSDAIFDINFLSLYGIKLQMVTFYKSINLEIVRYAETPDLFKKMKRKRLPKINLNTISHVSIYLPIRLNL